MPTIWITYAWDDNANHDVDFIAQELQAAGVNVKLDRWNIAAGKRLWEQIETFIQDEHESDAWLLYATTNSLASEPCREEYAYALDRALKSRGNAYPVIALFPGPVDQHLIPAGIRSRLYVSTTDPDWKERIKAAAERRDPQVARASIPPYSLAVHDVEGGHFIEVRPRAGVWYPFSIAVPIDEKQKARGQNPIILPGAPGHPPTPQGGFILQFDGVGEGTGSDGAKWWIMSPSGDASPAKSFFLFVTDIPTMVAFGPRNGPLFTHRFAP